MIGYAALIITAAASLIAGPAAAHETGQVGDVYQIVLERRMKSKSDDGGSSSSSDRWTMIERVIADTPEGILLEFDYAPTTAQGDRDSDWFYPARVLQHADGTHELADLPGIEMRIDAWLAEAGWTREICGEWIFTWNAFQIECDPAAKLDGLDAYDIAPPDLREGDLHSEPGALAPAPLTIENSASGLPALVARLQLDPQILLNQRASQQVIVARIRGEPITEAQALATLAGTETSGEITVRFETDGEGTAYRRHRKTVLHEKGADGVSEVREINEITTRTKLD